MWNGCLLIKVVFYNIFISKKKWKYTFVDSKFSFFIFLKNSSGQTTENKNKIIQGHLPGELSEDGWIQAEVFFSLFTLFFI